MEMEFNPEERDQNYRSIRVKESSKLSNNM